jgi:hypothetical protein
VRAANIYRQLLWRWCLGVLLGYVWTARCDFGLGDGAVMVHTIDCFVTGQSHCWLRK